MPLANNAADKIRRLQVKLPTFPVKLTTTRAEGIMGVHLWGRPFGADAPPEIVEDRGIPPLFDATYAFVCNHESALNDFYSLFGGGLCHHETVADQKP